MNILFVASRLTLEIHMNKVRHIRFIILMVISLCCTQELLAKKGQRSPAKAKTQTEQFIKMQSASDETAAYQERK